MAAKFTENFFNYLGTREPLLFFETTNTIGKTGTRPAISTETTGTLKTKGTTGS